MTAINQMCVSLSPLPDPNVVTPSESSTKILLELELTFTPLILSPAKRPTTSEGEPASSTENSKLEMFALTTS